MKTYNNYTADDLTMVVCAYKECEYLDECISSLIRQTQKPRIIISTSTPNPHIENIAGKYNVEIRVNPDGGQVKDYNFAMAQPETELVMLMHQDEVLKETFVEKVLQELNLAKDPIIAFTDYIEMHNDIVDEKSSRIVKIKRLMLFPMHFKTLMRHGRLKRMIQLLGDPITHPTVVCVKKEMPEVIFDERYKASMDWDLWERLSRQKGSFVYVNDVLLYHRMNEDNQTAVLFRSGNARFEEETEIFHRFWPMWIVKILMHFYSGTQKYY